MRHSNPSYNPSQKSQSRSDCDSDSDSDSESSLSTLGSLEMLRTAPSHICMTAPDKESSSQPLLAPSQPGLLSACSRSSGTGRTLLGLGQTPGLCTCVPCPCSEQGAHAQLCVCCGIGRERQTKMLMKFCKILFRILVRGSVHGWNGSYR